MSKSQTPTGSDADASEAGEEVEFEEGDEYDIDGLPDSEMEPNGKLEWVGNGILALAHNDQLVEFEYSKVQCTDVKYVTDKGDVVDSRSELENE